MLVLFEIGEYISCSLEQRGKSPPSGENPSDHAQ